MPQARALRRYGSTSRRGMELEWLKKKLAVSAEAVRGLIEANHPTRSTLYY